MKKKTLLLLLICITMVFAVAGCYVEEPAVSVPGVDINNDIDNHSDSDSDDNEIYADDEHYLDNQIQAAETSGQYDIDFTELSTVMATAMYNHIMMRYHEFLGQSIRVRGLYFSMILNDETLHFAMISEGDAGCCGGMFEFMFDDSDFTVPPDGSVVEVSGIISTISDNDVDFVIIEADEVILH